MLLRTTLVLTIAGLLSAQNCANTSVGRVPLNDLGAGVYQGFVGGLYPSGANVPPPAHQSLGLAKSAAVQPLGSNGAPSPTGRIVLLSIGMSNTTQEFSTWMPISNADPQRNGAITLVDGAQGGQTAAIISNPNANFWTVVAQRLSAASVTAQQVQVVWLKEANAGPMTGFPAAAQTLRDQLRTICQILKTNYPNLQLCYLSSRIYGGYATTTLNPEPYAYESGFAVKWVIEEQIAGSVALNADPALGPVLAPWLAWGPYTWADGLTPRSDGLTWLCSDYAPDGTHPGTSGRQKVAAALDQHFRNDATSTPWYLGGTPPLPTAQVTFYGQGCAGTLGIPAIINLNQPFLGNPMFRLGVDDGNPGASAILFLSTQSASISLSATCTALIDPSPTTLLFPSAGDPSTFLLNNLGRAFRQFAIPSDPAWAGVTLFAQWLIPDPQGAWSNLYSLTRAAQIRIGTPSP